MSLSYQFFKQSAAAAVVLTSVHTTDAVAADIYPPQPAARLMLGNLDTIPIGSYEFCKAAPRECDFKTRQPQMMIMNPVMWRVMSDVNRTVNNSIKPVDDIVQYGVEEKWTYPTSGKGDCEDFALQKRKELIEAGFVKSALLMTIARKPNGEGHAILTVRTTKGDFALDNLSSDITPIDKTGYTLIKTMDPTDYSRYVKIRGFDPGAGGPVVANNAGGAKPSGATQSVPGPRQ